LDAAAEFSGYGVGRKRKVGTDAGTLQFSGLSGVDVRHAGRDIFIGKARTSALFRLRGHLWRMSNHLKRD